MVNCHKRDRFAASPPPNHDRLHRLVIALAGSGQLGPDLGAIDMRETHISIVLLAGEHAYKFKKPVDFGFLDFSTLEKRTEYCKEEVRLNRRLAPELYCEALPITGTEEAPVLGGAGTPIEYCVRMRRFDAADELDAVLKRGEIGAVELDGLARLVAAFHTGLPALAAELPYGSPEINCQTAIENFRHLDPLLVHDPEYLAKLAELRHFTETQCKMLAPVFAARKAQGLIRECHGDMHLGNMARYGGRIVIYDCIEFSEPLRCIDVMNEAAFVLMDLEHRGRRDLAFRFLNAYLEETGDYEGVRVLRFYAVYRALVRAKVAALRLDQPDLDPGDREAAVSDYRSFIDCAIADSRRTRPFLVITHGVSGSGKTTLTLPLLGELGAVRIRSDVERKRLYGLSAAAKSGSLLLGGLYGPASTEKTYARLESLAGAILESGYPVVVDAAFLKEAQRRKFRKLAQAHAVPYVVLEFCAGPEELSRRILSRGGDASEATLEVLAHQLETLEPCTSDESPCWMSVDTGSVGDPQALALRLAARIGEHLEHCANVRPA